LSDVRSHSAVCVCVEAQAVQVMHGAGLPARIEPEYEKPPVVAPTEVGLSE
jgi:hypothetical protein